MFKVDKLVFIHSNIRLLSQFSESYRNGPYKEWNMDPDDTCLEESSIRIAEIRWSSLDTDIPNVNDEQQQRTFIKRTSKKGK